MAAKSSPPLFSTMTRENDLIEIHVGPIYTRHHVHRALLVHHSEYFRKALERCWKEGDERRVFIEDIEPAAFSVFVDWLYTGKIPDTDDACLFHEPEDENEWGDPQTSMLQLKFYVLADRLGAGELLNSINNYFVDGHMEHMQPPWYRTVIYAFENIPSGRRILTWLVNSHCSYSEEVQDVNAPGEQELLFQLPHEFLVRVMQRYRQLFEDHDWDSGLVPREYYEHGSEEEIM